MVVANKSMAYDHLETLKCRSQSIKIPHSLNWGEHCGVECIVPALGRPIKHQALLKMLTSGRNPTLVSLAIVRVEMFVYGMED